eukprot:1193437-Prorocentrum_minimum.AAC.1
MTQPTVCARSQTPEISRKMWICQTAWGNPRRGGCEESQGSCVEARGGRPGGERFARESFIPKGVERKI